MIAATDGEGRIEGVKGPNLKVPADLLDRAGIPVSLAPARSPSTGPVP
ncbi:hypothetical protein [Streptomyces sp. NPDC004284]